MKHSTNKRSRKYKKPVESSSQPSLVVKVDVSSSSAEETTVGWQESNKEKSSRKVVVAKAHHIRNKSIGGIDASEAVSKTFDMISVPAIKPEGIGDVATGIHNDTTDDITAGIGGFVIGKRTEGVHDVTIGDITAGTGRRFVIEKRTEGVHDV